VLELTGPFDCELDDVGVGVGLSGEGGLGTSSSIGGGSGGPPSELSEEPLFWGEEGSEGVEVDVGSGEPLLV